MRGIIMGGRRGGVNVGRRGGRRGIDGIKMREVSAGMRVMRGRSIDGLCDGGRGMRSGGSGGTAGGKGGGERYNILQRVLREFVLLWLDISKNVHDYW